MHRRPNAASSIFGFAIVFSALSVFSSTPQASLAASTLFVVDGDVVHAYDASTATPVAPDISLLGATSLAIGSNGNLFAVSSIPPQVFQYDVNTHAQVGPAYVTFNGQNDGHDVQGPQGMRFASNGNLYIADATLSEIHIYGSANNSLGTLTSNETVQPPDVAFDSAGNLYVASGNADILRSIAGSQPLTEFVPVQSGGLINPVSLSFGPDDKLYVLDIGGGSPAIRRYTSTGTSDGAIVTSGFDFFIPSKLAFGLDGKIYVSGVDFNTGSGQVLRFLTDGTPDGAFIASGLSNPTSMVFSVPEPNAFFAMALACTALFVWRKFVSGFESRPQRKSRAARSLFAN
jgi:sugar lactone lactonase YvrE